MIRPIIFAIFTAILPAQTTKAQSSASPEEQFAEEFSVALSTNKHIVSDEQMQALRMVQPLLAIAVKSDFMRRWFWHIVLPEAKQEEIAWDEAKQLVMEGKVIFVMQSHNLVVSMSLSDGRDVFTREPKIDEIDKVIKVGKRGQAT